MFTTVRRSVELTLAFLLFAAVAQAGITTSRLNVLITGARCGEVQNAFLVTGEDDDSLWVKLEPAGTCRWAADLGGNSVSTTRAAFSLRVDFARTGCRRAVGNEETLIAELEFACCNRDPVRSIKVQTRPELPVRYVRDVMPIAATRAHDPLNIKCLEDGFFPVGAGQISHAQLGGEDLYLQIGTSDRNHKTLGLRLDDIVLGADKHPLVLDRDGVAYQMAVQRAKGKDKSAPNLSANALSIDIRKLGELKFERAEITVVK